jgi:hypothetical protein
MPPALRESRGDTRDAFRPSAPLSGHALLQVASETLALGCLFERRGAAFIRIPVHRRQQMMGCEWHCRRAGGRLRAVSYTFELLEDWIALAELAPDRLAGLYRAILGRPEIAAGDLTWRADVFARGPEGYVWNTVRGAVHLNGTATAGFGVGPRPDSTPARLRVTGPALERGLLFLGGRDRTAEVLHATRRDEGEGPVARLEVIAPEEAGWSLEDLSLADGAAFTPLGLFRSLRGDAAGDPGTGWDTVPAQPPQNAARAGAVPFLPGPLVTHALLRQAGMATMEPA